MVVVAEAVLRPLVLTVTVWLAAQAAVEANTRNKPLVWVVPQMMAVTLAATQRRTAAPTTTRSAVAVVAKEVWVATPTSVLPPNSAGRVVQENHRWALLLLP